MTISSCDMKLLRRHWPMVACDVDGTLTDSKQAICPSMASALNAVARHSSICLITGADMAQMQRQVLDHMHVDASRLKRFHIMATCGTAYYRWEDGRWTCRYRHALSADQVKRAQDAIYRVATALKLWETRTQGPAIDNRGSQVTYSALGQHADIATKEAWDPTGAKRDALAEGIQRELPDLEVRRGGSTSIDVTMKGVDKAYGINKLLGATGLDPSDVIFFGDSLMPGGNDYPVVATSVACVQVDSWRDTRRCLRAIEAAGGE